LRVEHLEAPNSVNHTLEVDSFNNSILSIDALNSQNVIAKVESLKAPLLIQKCDNCTSTPMKSFAKEFPENFKNNYK
jgi:hypothetical protein